MQYVAIMNGVLRYLAWLYGNELQPTCTVRVTCAMYSGTITHRGVDVTFFCFV